MTNSDTIRRVARPRGVLSEATKVLLRSLGRSADDAQAEYKAGVVEALGEGSFSAVAEATGLSKDTLQRWKREAAVNGATQARATNRASVAARHTATKREAAK